MPRLCVVNLDYEQTPAGRGWVVEINGLDHIQAQHFQSLVTCKVEKTSVVTVIIGPGEELKFLGGDIFNHEPVRSIMDSYFEILDFLGYRLIGVSTSTHPENGKRSIWTMGHVIY
ncbi:uncharacterized protein LOC110857346 [Folsomia candida]|uniref:Uncharacterized protein n=1 Tax=Folsomia candida TaxID=158441 RepID=A0A226DL24_FOLCA|nr:uncharacterized protein LOC110857346 [Folsomia candida]OXA45311.1 hypothetical protein Fcan01_20236 [Folsomia candida]